MHIEKIADHIVNWLKEYATSANMNGFTTGVSGGIDSAVTSTLCARTGMRTLCLELPIHQAKNQVTRAEKHIRFLKERFANVTDLQINLTPVFDQFRESVPEVSSSSGYDLAMANARARLRMTTLYYFAGLHGYLVAGTGNKVEDFGVGFFTKYGDGGVDLSPIADLTKSEVYELGRYLGIDQEILSAPPTDGLFGDSRTDEEQLGASYDELEWAMEMQEQNRNPAEFSGRKLEVFEIYKRLNAANRHKIQPIPVCNVPVHLKK